MNNIERIREWLTKQCEKDRIGLYRMAAMDAIDFISTLPPDDPWQPIETAPDDGLPMDVMSKSAGRSINMIKKPGSNLEYFSLDKRKYYMITDATHWMRVQPPMGGAG